MIRRLYLLLFVLFVVGVEPTFGVGLFRHRRVRCHGPVTCEAAPCCKAAECFCVQYRIWNVPGTDFDYWHGLYYPDGCGEDEAVEHWADDAYAWYPQDTPQQCVGDPPRCIGQGDFAKTLEVVPGYLSVMRLTLPDQATAKRVLKEGFSNAGRSLDGDVEFYKIRPYKLTHILDTSADYIYVAVGKWKIEGEATDLGLSPAGIPCFGLQMDNTRNESFVELNNTNCQHATVHKTGDKQIRLIFEAADREDRVATIWLE